MSESNRATSILRSALPYLTIAVVIAVGYDGCVFYSRWNEAHQARKAEARREAEDARSSVDRFGGDSLKILAFYASPGAIRRGDHALICYGVNAAENVRIEPPVEQLHPALSRCFQVSPGQNTDYRLTAQDRAGHVVTQSLSIQVLPAAH